MYHTLCRHNKYILGVEGVWRGRAKGGAKEKIKVLLLVVVERSVIYLYNMEYPHFHINDGVSGRPWFDEKQDLFQVSSLI